MDSAFGILNVVMTSIFTLVTLWHGFKASERDRAFRSVPDSQQQLQEDLAELKLEHEETKNRLLEEESGRVEAEQLLRDYEESSAARDERIRQLETELQAMRSAVSPSTSPIGPAKEPVQRTTKRGRNGRGKKGGDA